MGCDGGTIPKRDELVRTKKKPEQADKDAETVAKWKHCAITQEELRSPIVSCELGRLYNKDAVIEYLLDKTAVSEMASHIRNLKDIIELKLTINTTFDKSKADAGDSYIDRQASEYICPVTGLEMNGKYKFCYIRFCGCVLSDRALQQIKSNICHKCERTYDKEDVVVINASGEDLQILKARMEERRLQAKLNKKAKRESKRQKTEESGDASVAKKVKFVSEAAGSSKQGPSGSTIKEVNIRDLVMTEEKLKDSYRVAKDPKASETFKSLFTSHESCKQQPRAHWITYNPLYN